MAGLVASGDPGKRFDTNPTGWTDVPAAKAICVMTDGESCCFNEG